MYASPPAQLDVRTIPPAVRHATIFSFLEGLAPGASFQIVNDHDPVPLRRQIEARYPDAYAWTYLLRGPELWQVEIRRIGEAGADGGACDAPGGCTCG